MGSESNFLRPHFLLYIYGETAGIKNKEEKVMNIMDLATGLDTAWVLLGAALVFFRYGRNRFHKSKKRG